MVYRNFLQRHKSTTRTQNFSPTLYHFENTVRNGLSAYLLIRWSRVRISPDPPVIQRDHSNVVPFLLAEWNAVVTVRPDQESVFFKNAQ